MRVLALVTDAYGGFGGISAYNREFLKALADGGAEVVTFPRSGATNDVPERIEQLPPRHARTLYSAAVLKRLARDRRFDSVWCGHIRMCGIATLASRFVRCPAWMQIHGVDAWEPVGGRMMRACIREMSVVTAVSNYTRSRFLTWADVSAHKVRVCPNCVDDRYQPGPKRSDLLERYKIGSGPVLLTTSRISTDDREKGHDRVIRILPKLRKRFPGLVYIIGGDGNDRSRLEGIADQLGVSENCRFIGRISEDEMVDHYRLADVFVMPSKKEGFGIVYLEAMACGIPAVGLNVDGSVDPLDACNLGHAVPEGALADTLDDILSSPPPRPDNVPGELTPFSRAAFGRRVRELAEEVVASGGRDE